MADETDTGRHPRDVGTTFFTFSFPGEGYGNKYQSWFFKAHRHEITGRVLDVGAEGDQMSRYGLSKSDGNEYLSLDMRANPSLDVVGDGRALPFCDGTFDTVILREVLEHVSVTDLPTLIEEVYRVLSNGGRLLVTTPFRFQIHGYGYTDKVRLTADGLDELLQEAGFEDVSIYKAGGFAESVCSPLQTAWFMTVLYTDVEELRFAFAAVHYPAVVFGTIFGAIQESVFGENILDETFYLHNLASALKQDQD